MIKPSIFEFFGAPAEFHERFDASRSQRYFEAYLDLWASAEPAGFEGIFFSEHHFGAGLLAGAQPADRQPCVTDEAHCGWARSAWWRPTTRRGS